MNTDELKNFIEKIKGDKKTMLILSIGIIGMLLIMFSGTHVESSDKMNTDNSPTILTERELAYDVEKFISNIHGAGKTKVILTFESYEEMVYATDIDEKIDANGKNDAQIEYVIIDSDDGEDGLKLKILSPKIRGVAVLCAGGDNPVIKEQIITALSALFDISSNNISVAPMAN